MRNRVDKLGVTEPEIRTQGDDQIVIQLPGVKRPRGGGGDHRHDRAARALRPRDVARGAVRSRSGGYPIENPSLYDLLARVQSQVGGRVGRVLRREPDDEARRRAARSAPRADALRRVGREAAAGPRALRGAAGHGRHHVRRAPPSSAPAARRAAASPPDRTYYYLFKYEPPDIPQMTGEDLKLSGTRADFDTSPGGGGRPIVTMEFTGRRRGQVRGDHARRLGPRPAARNAAALRDRARPRDQDLPADRLHGLEPLRRHRRRAGADPGPRLDRRGAGHRDRPPDRRAAGQVRDARPHRHLRDARQGLAPGGMAGGDRRASSSSRSSCSCSTASSGSWR